MTQPSPPFVQIQFDKSSYAPGEQMVATVTYSIPEESHVEVDARLRFLGGEAVSEPMVVPVADLSIQDSDSAREWTLQANNGATAVFTAVA